MDVGGWAEGYSVSDFVLHNVGDDIQISFSVSWTYS